MTTWLYGVILLLGACDLVNKTTDDDAEPKGKVKSSAPEKETKSATSTENAEGLPPTPTAIPGLKPGRSALPKAEEWDGVGEVTVKGSSALNCETKMVREWLRISCRGKNDTGGTPTTVRVLKGDNGEVFTATPAGVTSLVGPFVEGVSIEAVFAWTDKAHRLVVEWPRGAPKPAVVGVFAGAASPLDAAGDAREAEYQKILCACDKQLLKRGDCLVWLYNEDCLRSYRNNCGSLLACASGHPDAAPKCPAGMKANEYNRCVRG